MKSSCLATALVAIAFAPSLQSQSLEEYLARPVGDYFFEEQEDGSILAADARGNYYFANWAVYSQSAFFQEHGMRCGTDRLPVPIGFGTVGDCNSSNTNIEAQYDPATGIDYVIPVVFHILRTNAGGNDVSDTRINEQIDVLNEDFGAFGGGAAGTNTRIQFTLAAVTRSNNTTWYNDGGAYYNTLAMDPDNFLNIYTNNASGNLGYATLPWSGAGSNTDRVVVLWSTVGNPAPYGPPYHLGRSATHEVGHYLGLYHTFQGGCTSVANCNDNGDLICDTNPESSPNFSPCNRTTCGSLDPTHNYLDYSDDPCMDNFTPEQANRMRCTLENWRPDLADSTPPLPGLATAPNPANNKTDVDVNADLFWTAGMGATSHDVYFGTNPTPGGGEFQGNQVGTSFDPGTLTNSVTYYWRIDEVNANGTTTGTVWNFTAEDAQVPPAMAANPLPLDGSLIVGRNEDLSWTAGTGASSHDVYFGTSNPPPFVGNQAGTTFDPGTMNRLQTYYWRVDEVNVHGTTTGTVWSFTVRRNAVRKKL